MLVVTSPSLVVTSGKCSFPQARVLRLGVGQAGPSVLGAEHPERQSSGPSRSGVWWCCRDREKLQRGQDGWVLLAVCGYTAEQPFQRM